MQESVVAEQLKRLLAGYYPEDDAAKELRQTTRTLRLWRQQGIGPAWVKIGRRVFYAEAALLAWIRSLERQPVRSRQRGMSHGDQQA
jgi:hypothetical protein